MREAHEDKNMAYAYKGYLIQRSFAGDLWFVKKDGFTVYQSNSEIECRAAVDGLTG